jgi:hypothetical protein
LGLRLPSGRASRPADVDFSLWTRSPARTGKTGSDVRGAPPSPRLNFRCGSCRMHGQQLSTECLKFGSRSRSDQGTCKVRRRN